MFEGFYAFRGMSIVSHLVMKRSGIEVTDDTSVRFSSDLSEGEKEATESRKKTVLECLKTLGISCEEKTMPNIAVLGSGGGLRATIALLGTLAEMKNQGLLDAVMYLCGVSGSTWCMSSLYNGKDWAKNIEALEESMCDYFCWAPIDIEKELGLVTKAAEDELFSLTDVWEAFVVKSILKLYSERKLSEHKAASSNGINPYPIYAAIEQNTFDKDHTRPGAWFEFTPHESGFPGLDVFVSTEDLGSKFQGGCLTDAQEEKHMSYLQVKENISFHPPSSENSTNDYWTTFQNTVVKILSVLFESELKDPEFYKKIDNFCSKLITCFSNWTWGSTNNFLYKNGKIQTDGLDEREVLNLIDAALANNCAYPLFLRPARHVGLILSFDFSDGDPFETLKKASQYCEENQIPFPPIDPDVIKDQDNPSNCYVFEGQGTPTVMHFPLFNTKNCPEKIKQSREKFGTFNMSYTKNEMKELLNKAKMNVSENKDNIVKEIKKVISAPQDSCSAVAKHGTPSAPKIFP
ncbi:cytosolic phospholipase A2 gamma-like [Pelodiscus sinensis]|uniref:cytosolic phospholipase A2 gamma-like n=1 Tax=Pelodiscus sinensis TaxID=13735 RepID=UPI003F6C38C5